MQILSSSQKGLHYEVTIPASIPHSLVCRVIARISHRRILMPKAKTTSRAAKSKATNGKLTEAQIAVHWKEEQYFYPTKEFKAQANLVDSAFIKKFSEKNFP